MTSDASPHRSDDHLSDDLLAGVALGDALPAGQQFHLTSCARCRLVVSDLLAVMTLMQDDHADEFEQSPPPDHVWRDIAAARDATSVTVEDLATVVPITAARHTRDAAATSRRRRPGGGPLMLAAAAVAGVLVGGGLVAAADAWQSEATIVASAPLAPVPGGPATGQSGVAQIEQVADGEVLAISTSALTDPTGYYEVWLLDPTSGGMIAMGVVPGGSGTVTLPVPPGVDLSQYAAVDISDEPMDGDPGHSSVSVLRGQLAT